MADAIIIGAGYAGMSAAALLACAGRKIIVLEAADAIGGRALSYTDEAGYVWEYGAHSHRLSHKGIANDVFRRLGETIDFLPEAKDAKLIFKGRLWERPEGPAGFLKTPMLSFGARLALLALLIRIKRPILAKNIIFAARLPLLPDLMVNRQLPKATLDYAKNIENSSALTIDFITDRPVTNIRSD